VVLAVATTFLGVDGAAIKPKPEEGERQGKQMMLNQPNLNFQGQQGSLFNDQVLMW
jgi:hypothetical protein